jgi:hypothetical protein
MPRIMNCTSNKSDLADFQRQQYRFTAHIRDPQRQPVPDDIEDRRMAIYRELFYNNVEDFMADSFPVLRQILADRDWHALIRDYFSRHRARTPLFPEMPREFLHYLETEHQPGPADPPFLLELAHYEWVELALSMAEAEPVPADLDLRGDLLEQHPVVSDLAWLLQYRYPVHQISPTNQPRSAPQQATLLLVYRDPNDDIGFMEINPVTARLLQLLDEHPEHSGRTILQNIATELQHAEPEQVVQGGLEILEDLRRRHIIPGTRPISS